MADLDRLFDGFDTGPTPPPPPTEIRRRGDRLRRRNRVLAAAGTVAAVALLALPLTLLDRDTGDSAPTPADVPAQVSDPILAIPDDFPIAAGIESGLVAKAPFEDLARCGEQLFTLDLPAEPVDVASLTAGEPVFEGVERNLFLYPHHEDAAAVFAALRDAYTDCPTAGGRTATPSDSPFTNADESAVFTLAAADGGFDLEVLHLVRTGNLVYRATYDPDVDDVDPTLEGAASLSAPLVEAMASFRAGAVVLDPAAAMSQDRALQVTDLPDPEKGWVETVDDGPLLCQRQSAEELGATTSITRAFTAGDEEIRTLTLEFRDVEAASRARDAVVGWIDDCEGASPYVRAIGEPVSVGTGFVPPTDPDLPSGTSVDLRAGGDGYGEFVERPIEPASWDVATVAVAQVADRIVLLTYGTTGAPRVDRSDDLLRAAADRMVGLEPGGS